MGSINTYRAESISKALSEAYNLENATISETSKGGDNTVLLVTSEVRVFPPHILKILETKSKEEIETANSVAQGIPRAFIAQRLIPTSSQGICTSIDGKNATLYNYVDGTHIENFGIRNTRKLAAFMRDFHDLSERHSCDTDELLAKEMNLLKLYFSNEVREQGDPKRNEFYEEFFRYLEVISDKLSSSKIIKGMSHNDFSPGNLLWDKDSGNYNLIDWDNICFDDFQIMDLIHFIVKSKIILNERLLKAFIKEYQLDLPLEILYALSLIFSVRALLSTDYYTYTMKKITPAWVERNGQETLDTLLSVASHLHPLVIHGR